MRILGIFIGLLISLRGLCLPGGNFVFLLDSVAANTQTQVAVPVRAIHFDSIISIQGTIGFDTAELSFAGVQGFGLPSMSNSNFGVSHVSNGWLTFSWNEASLLPISVADSTVLFEVLFQVLGIPGSQTPVSFLNGPTILEVVGVGYNVLPYLFENGMVTVKVPPTCPAPDSLSVSGIGQNQAQLEWQSSNPGATYIIEWGPIGFTPGNGLGQASGISALGLNSLQVNGLLPDSSYAFYVQEQCASLNSLLVGPFEFSTAVIPVLVPVELFADSVEAFHGDTVTLHFRVREFTNIISMQFSLAWDTAVAHYLGTAGFGLPSMSNGNFNVSQAANGSLSVSWNDPTLVGVTLADSSSVFGLSYVATGHSPAATAVAYVNSPVPIEVVDDSFVPLPATTVNGHIQLIDTSVTVAMQTGIQLTQTPYVYPNPIGEGISSFHVKTGLDALAILDLGIVDQLGKPLSAAQFTWTALDGEIIIHLREGLPAGQWLLRINSTEGVTHHRIMKLGK